ncbi:MAG: hypothetical protein ACTSUJ_01055 [Candidatus Njordarchaeales archaeon]
MEKCELCGKKAAKTICIKCRRLICESCESPEAMLCRECYEFKRSLEDQRELVLNYIEKMLNVCSLKIQNQPCLRCNVLRELAISLYKMLRDLLEEANKELFEGILNRGKKIEKELKRLLVIILTVQGLSIAPEP